MRLRQSHQILKRAQRHTLGVHSTEVRRHLAVCAASVLTLALTALPASAQTTLAPGQPPLTQEMVTKFDGFFEWVLDAHLTQEQRQQLQQDLVTSWTTGNQDDINTVQQIVTLSDQLATQPEDARSVVQAKLQSDMLTSMRQQPNDPLSQILLGVYNAAHPPLAKGNPPLTRQMSDSFLEFTVFAADQVWNRDIQTTPEAKDAFAQAMAAGYSGLSADQQRFIGQMPQYWAALRVTWPTLSDAERAGYEEQWKPLVGDSPSNTADPGAQIADPGSGGSDTTAAPPAEAAASSDSLADFVAKNSEQQMITNWAQVHLFP